MRHGRLPLDWGGRGTGGERGKGGKSYWGGNGIIEMERQLSEITETELKFPSQLIILFLAPLSAKGELSLSQSSQVFCPSIWMIHADNLGSAV